ncbi:MAG: hypothetical protein GW938_08445 [Leptospira sp.]|nr:hypothetical protein [Leptospira sp.]NCS93847.1 hypothetical protein [Leptospira sp.]
MKKQILISLILGSAFFLSADISAKCFAFSKAKDVSVCVDGNDNKARGKAKDACKKNTGKDCGNVTGYSGSKCNSGKVNCVDSSGKVQKKISVD